MAGVGTRVSCMVFDHRSLFLVKTPTRVLNERRKGMSDDRGVRDAQRVR